jgi:hypothetical protein
MVSAIKQPDLTSGELPLHGRFSDLRIALLSEPSHPAHQSNAFGTVADSQISSPLTALTKRAGVSPPSLLSRVSAPRRG